MSLSRGTDWGAEHAIHPILAFLVSAGTLERGF
jgi:hypothetical protein